MSPKQLHLIRMEIAFWALITIGALSDNLTGVALAVIGALIARVEIYLNQRKGQL